MMMHLTDRQLRYLLLTHLLPAVLINFLINFGLGWLFFHVHEHVHLWETLSFKVLPSSISIDLVPTTFFLIFFTSLIASHQVQQHLSQGRVEPLACSDFLCRISHPSTPMTSLCLAVSLTLALVPATVLVFHWNSINMLPLWPFIWFKAIYAAVLSALFTPLVVLRTMAE